MEIIENNFSADKRNSDKLETWLGKYLFGVLDNEFENFAYALTDGKSIQKKGSDLLVKRFNTWQIVDIKGASTGYLQTKELTNEGKNVHKDTYCFEINYLSDFGHLKDGWFYQSLIGEKLTDYLALTWNWGEKTPDGLWISWIEKSDVYWYKVKTLKEALEKEGLTSEILFEKSVNLRNSKETIGYLNDDGLRLIISNRMKTRPANLVIPQDWLNTVLEEKDEVTEEGIIITDYTGKHKGRVKKILNSCKGFKDKEISRFE